METLSTNFYTGFEGEPEVTLVRVGAEEHMLKAWDGYFSQVLDAIEPGSDGKWQGLTLYYHLGTGWYDTEEFEVENPLLFASQLLALDTSSLDPTTLRFYYSLLAFVQAAVAQRQELLIRYF